MLVTGTYEFDNITLPADDEPIGGLLDVTFTPSKRLDLHQLDPKNSGPEEYYQPSFSKQHWQFERFKQLLQEIASYQATAFFVSQRNACIVAPYDGGVDVLLKDEATRDYYREKYRAWLSARPDGL